MSDVSWQKRARNFLGRYVDLENGSIVDPLFEAHIKYLKENTDELDSAGYPANMYPSNLSIFMNYFNLPFEMKDMMRHFILTGKVDISLAKPPLAIIDETDGSYRLNISRVDEEEYWQSYGDEKELKIVISPRATPTEIREFVLANADFIKKKQEKYEVSQIRPRPKTARNIKYMQQRESGKKFSEIAEDAPEPTNYAEVNIAYRREKQRRNKH